MNNLLVNSTHVLKRISYIIAAALLLVASSPFVQPGRADAAQLSSRSIKLSDSGASGTSITSGVGSGSNVTYRVGFTSTTTAKSLVIDFCAESPIIADTCTAPTGMNAASAATTAVTGNIGASGWTITASASQLKLASDGTTNDITPGAQVFDIIPVVNPSTVGTFYARIYTYANNTWGTYSSATSVGTYLDYGGIALSTTSTITITARVQETLTFCVTSADPSLWTTTNDCSDTVVAANPPAVTLGHFSGPTRILDAQTVDNNTPIYSQLSTNATNGAVINIRNSNLTCGGLSADGGATCAIPAHNSGSGAGATAMAIGSTGGAQFGMFVSNGVAGVNGVGTLTPSAAYHDAAHTTIPTDLWYGMDTTTSGNNTISTFGSTLATAAAPLYRINTTYVFAATAALTTPAGIYTANMSMIATGTF